MKDKLWRFYNVAALIWGFIKSIAIKHVFYIGISFAIGSVTFSYVNLNDLASIVSTLQNLSAAVFTLAGIWIAYSYPQAIAAYTKPKSVSVIPSGETGRIEKLVLITLTSAFVIVSLLIYNLASVLLKDMPFVIVHRDVFKILAVSFIVYLSINQIRAVLVVMITNVQFINELHHKKSESDADKDL
ncbi:hypothetical protein HWV00_01835 [Moritella sp. 24]|uniref:hypothetical protein n=1 Tax=Moritella sp. 24 TaxID=2746230 RepID=UPI001BAD9197|nr:hypothetical protein [Moritella sp. 24]QUM75081.1 hypothetical protein HWV00_01835 [Moritella sp. 24]